MAGRSTKPKQTAKKRPKNPREDKADIDIDEFEKLAALQCTQQEIAAFFRVCRKTIVRRLKEPEYRMAFERGQAAGLISLRRKQFQQAESSASMAIFLGKQYLGQRDFQAIRVTGPGGGPIQHVDLTKLTDAELSHLEVILSRIAVAQSGPGSGGEGEA
jgi:hypothetical protein